MTEHPIWTNVHFLKTFIQTLLIPVLFLCPPENLSGQRNTNVNKQPNIIIFIADDLGTTDINPYGNKFVQTPYLREFAASSLTFNRAFAGSPTCTPARSTLLTGLMPLKHGAHGNHSGVKPGTKALPQYLRPLGYRVAIAGKYHIGPEEVFDFERITGTNVPEPGFEKNPGLNYDLILSPVDKWLSAVQKNKPFLLVVADHSPHVVWPENSSYNPDEIDIPGNHVDTRETRISRSRYYTDITKMDKNFGDLLASVGKNGLADNTIIIFVADQGPQFPFAKWTVYDYGVQIPLIIKWPSHFGNGMRTDALVSAADLVPTIAEIAGGQAPADIDGKSFLPVLNEKSAEHRKYVFASHTGDKMMNRSPARMVRTGQYKYILNLAPEILYTTHMDRAKDHDGGREYWPSWREKSFYDAKAANILWRYHHRPAEELYDVLADPLEMKNLANDEKYLAVMYELREELKKFRVDQGDNETGPEKIQNDSAAKPGKPVAPYIFK